MAKKKTQARRVPRASEPRMYGDGKPSQATPAATTAQAPASGGGRAAQPLARSAAATSTVDYRYVSADLKRLGLTAVALFGLMVVLGFIIR